MAKFRQVARTYLFRKYIAYWRNVIRNYDEECGNTEFLGTVLDCMNRKRAETLLMDAFTVDEFKNMVKVQKEGGAIGACGSWKDVFRIAWNDESGRKRMRVVLDSVGEYLLSAIEVVEDPVEKRFAELSRMLKLSDLETEIAMLAYLLDETGFAWPRRLGRGDLPMYFAMAIDRSCEEICEAIAEKGRLRSLGIVDSCLSFNRRIYSGFLNGSEHAPLEMRFYRRCETLDVLPWSFFGDKAVRDGELLARMLSSNATKCNVLLYGAPGTGKSSFARSLAKEVGRTAFDVPLDGEMKKGDREACIRVANERLDRQDSLLIIDEADGLLRGSSADYFSMSPNRAEKGEVNMLLDEMSVPAVWITNVSADEMDESVRRRFDYSICFKQLGATQRESVWRNLVGKFGLKEIVHDVDLVNYASAYDTSAGGISNVLETVKRLDPRPEEVASLVSRLMKSHCELMGIAAASNFLPAKGYSLEGLNIRGKFDLESVVGGVRNFLCGKFAAADADRPRMNILLFGPPGTGKTEFVKYLGQTLGRKVLVKKGSDILDKYVGGTERRIAEAFRLAESERAILFFDEIDGLVQDREGASNSWEISQVNELFQQMENFDGVMVAATNFSKNCDSAILRRFTYKLEFDYLNHFGKRVFFERIFKTRLSDKEFLDLGRLENLSPGDFRTVRQELFYLNRWQTNADRISALRAECELKKDGRKLARIGFGV